MQMIVGADTERVMLCAYRIRMRVRGLCCDASRYLVSGARVHELQVLLSDIGEMLNEADALEEIAHRAAVQRLAAGEET